MKKLVKVGNLNAEELTKAFVEENHARGVFWNVVSYALSMYIKDNYDLWLPKKVIDVIIHKIAMEAVSEHIEPFLRQLVQQGKITVFSKNGKDYYYRGEGQ